MVVVRTRSHRDCGIACVAMIAGLSYEQVAAAARAEDWRGNAGLHNRQVLAIAALVGLRLTPVRRYSLVTARGILRIRWTCARAQLAPGGHFVVVDCGLVVCPSSGETRSVRSFLDQYQPRLCTLLRAD